MSKKSNSKLNGNNFKDDGKLHSTSSTLLNLNKNNPYANTQKNTKMNATELVRKNYLIDVKSSKDNATYEINI